MKYRILNNIKIKLEEIIAQIALAMGSDNKPNNLIYPYNKVILENDSVGIVFDKRFTVCISHV